MKFIRIVVFLVLVCFLSGLMLSLVWRSSRDRIAANARRAKEDAIGSVLPGGRVIEKSRSGQKYWLVEGRGYAFEAKGMGFQDEVSCIIGVDTDFNSITGSVVLKCLETPGLGGEIVKDKFLSQFKGSVPPFEVVKETPSDPSEIEAVTGATISSTVMVDMINSRFRQMKAVIQGQK